MVRQIIKFSISVAIFCMFGVWLIEKKDRHECGTKLKVRYLNHNEFATIERKITQREFFILNNITDFKFPQGGTLYFLPQSKHLCKRPSNDCKVALLCKC